MLKYALITGHKGFIGRHFATHLRDQGWEVVGLDIQNGQDCRDYFRHNPSNWYHFDLVIHGAAVVGGRITIENDPMAVAADLAIDAEMFQWALKTKQTCPIIYFSSSAVYPVRMQSFSWGYGDSKMRERYFDPTDESWDQPDATYGFAKLAGEVQARIAREQYGLEVYVFRPFSGYGWDQDLAYPFPSFIQRAIAQEDPFEIWGDGKQVRDWIHVSDIVEAVLKAIEVGEHGPVNLCSGVGVSFTELAELVCHNANYSPRFRYVIEAPRGVDFRVGHPEKMHAFYRPRKILHEGIQEAFQQWHLRKS